MHATKSFLTSPNKLAMVMLITLTSTATHAYHQGNIFYPSAYVQTIANSLPHLNSNFLLIRSNHIIKLSAADTSDYVFSTIRFPGLLLGFGILALIILGLIMMSRLCCNCGKSAPDVKSMNGKNPEEYAAWVKIVVCRKTTLLVFFCFFLILAFSSAQITWYGSSKFNMGVSGIREDFGNLADIFTGVNNLGLSLSTTGSYLTEQLGGSVCNATHPKDIKTIQVYVASFISTGLQIKSDTSSIKSYISSAADAMSTYGVYYKRILFYIGYPVVSGFCLLIALGAVLQNKILSQVMWFFTYWLVLLLALISTISMTIVFILADFCMEPYQNLLEAASNTSRSYVTYYSSCLGKGPLDESFSNALNATSLLNQSISRLLSNECTGDSKLMAALTQLPTIETSINSTQFLIECPKIQNILHTTIDTSICRNFFDGLFVYFLCAFCTSIFLYVVLCTSSVMWSYYDPFYWFLNPDDERDIEGGGITEFEDGDNSYAKEIPIADSNASFYDEKSNEIVDPIPIASPSRPLAKKASIFELLVMNENEQRLALKEIELRENAKKKKRLAIDTTAPSAPQLVEDDLRGSNF